MRTRIAAGLAVLSAALVALAAGSPNHAAAQDKSKLPSPKHLYGHDLKVRPGGEQEWAKARKTGVEFFHDEGTKTIVAVSDTGALAVVPAPVGALGADKTCLWLTAHDLGCRKPGEPIHTQKTKKFGVELFRDRASNQLLYVCETGTIALARVPAGLVADKGPDLQYGLEPRVRSEDQIKFDDAKKFGMEIFKDENTGGLVYITETGGLSTAVSPPGTIDKKKVAAPKTMYGLVLRVRNADEDKFTGTTKKMGVEVFEDANANTLFYITEAGFVAAVPNAKIPADAKGGVTWKSAMALGARKPGEPAFTDKTKKYGVEVFEDKRTGNLIFISETGSIAVLPK